MWDFLAHTMNQRAVILTTHSMEECEALCTRIGILVMGRMRCMGPAQHLKNKFGSGFQIDVSVQHDSFIDPLRRFFHERFQNVQEVECFGGSIKFRIQPKQLINGALQPMSLADVFSYMEADKKNLGIVQYSVGQTTLEQIFINFARQGDIEEFASQAPQSPTNVVVQQ
eukprot:TRINITY_DN1415_c0_g1_i1.p2 TRINITY_DN1415_c0_g1~~TRINITY_DN1415_c0_g1_i1.p2  ORF type:complete len:169 (+),score=69.06 TRINITY_DN1415_c0_g1_i1:112-618(+)